MKCEICGAENPPSMNHTSMHTCICVDCCRDKKNEWQKRAEEAEGKLAKALAEIEEHHELVRMCHTRTIEADKLWQKAHNQPDVWPDLGVLIEWLLLRLKNQETIIEANRATIKDKDALIEQMYEAIKFSLIADEVRQAKNVCASDINDACETSRLKRVAALEAAERGRVMTMIPYGEPGRWGDEAADELKKQLAEAQKEIERLKSLVIECSGWNWLDDEGYDSIPEKVTDAVDVIIVERLNMPKGLIHDVSA